MIPIMIRFRAFGILGSTLLLASLMFLASPAYAQPSYSASQCQEGIAGPYDQVFFSQYYPDGPPVRLLCGTPEGKGVLHIVGGANPHPIPAEQDSEFNACLGVIFGLANRQEIPTDPGNVAIQVRVRTGATATAVWEEATREIVTVYTSDGAQGNNWPGCAAA